MFNFGWVRGRGSRPRGEYFGLVLPLRRPDLLQAEHIRVNELEDARDDGAASGPLAKTPPQIPCTDADCQSPWSQHRRHLAGMRQRLHRK